MIFGKNMTDSEALTKIKVIFSHCVSDYFVDDGRMSYQEFVEMTEEIKKVLGGKE